MKYPPYERDLASALLAIGIILGVFTSGDAHAQDAPYVQAETGASFLGEWAVGEPSPGTLGYGLSAGYRWSTFGIGVLAEHNLWLVNSVRNTGSPVPDSVLNLGLEGGITYYGDRLRTGLAVGTSTLLVSTEVVTAGHTGLFFEVQPAAVRISLGAGWTTEIEPLNFIAMAPVLDSIPLFDVAYRTKVALERSF